MSLRHRLRDSRLLTELVARTMSLWLRLCTGTTRWRVEGDEELRKTLKTSPVILALWHEHMLLGPVHWRRFDRRIMSLVDTSPIGRVAGVVQGRFGQRPMPMSARSGNLAVSRLVKETVAEGLCIGVAADGPVGPARVPQDAALIWARTTGLPVFTYAWSTGRCKRLKTWDRMRLPLPFTRGVIRYVRWDTTVPRRPDPAEWHRLRDGLRTAMNDCADRADATLAGTSPPPRPFVP